MQDITIDTRLFRDVPMHPKLLTLLQEMSHFEPTFQYEAIDSMGHNDSKRISAAAVFVDGEPVGKVGINLKYMNATGAREVIYFVVSDGIRKSRGSRNTKETKHLKLAMRAVRETFKRAESSLIAERLINDAKNKAERIRGWAHDHARNVLYKAIEPVLAYLQGVDDGTVSPNGGLPASLTQALDPKWREYLRDRRIADAVYDKFAAKEGIVVRIMRDDTMQAADIPTAQLRTIKSTYDLPTNYQEKLTILKIMNDDQPVEHVGFKFSDYDHVNGVRTDYQAFFLIDGPTYTNC